MSGWLWMMAAVAGTVEPPRAVPDTKIETLEGKAVSSTSVHTQGKPTIVMFWATWCSPCKRQLNTHWDDYEDVKGELKAEIVAIAIDDARNKAKVAPYVQGKGITFPVYLDPASDLKRKMGVNNVPHTFILNAEGAIVWETHTYAPGDETKMYAVIEELNSTAKK